MIKNYFKIAWRNLFKNKTFSLINVLGLALGMTCSLFILLWVNDEQMVDGFHANGANLYSVYERSYHDGQVDAGHYTQGLLSSEMKLKFPEVEYATGMAWDEFNTFEGNNKILKEHGDYGSPDFFMMFSYPLIAGDASTALKTSVDIALSRKMAISFFGSPEEAMGKSIRFNDQKDLKITAVFENVPENSSRKFDYIINWETFLENNKWARDWSNSGPNTFLVLREGTDLSAFREKIKSFIELYNREENSRKEIDVQKYSEMYLYSNFKNGEIIGGRIQYVILFSVVAVFILLIACINFMNLSTARSVKRAKEIGIRKVVGAIRSSLIGQFIGEALLTVVLAFVISLLLVILILPSFNEVTQKHIVLPYTSVSFWLSLIALVILTGFVSGSYPALYLSSFNPAGVLKGALKFTNVSRFAKDWWCFNLCFLLY
jgi:putative ABC transport system permease protein